MAILVVQSSLFTILLLFLIVKEFAVKKSSRTNTFDAKSLGSGIQALWERSVKVTGVKSKEYRPDGVLHVDGNITHSDLEPYMTDATLTKLKLNYSGSEPLSHPNEAELVDEMLRNGKELNKVIQA